MHELNKQNSLATLETIEEVISAYPDADNHHIDAVRYGTEYLWKRGGV